MNAGDLLIEAMCHPRRVLVVYLGFLGACIVLGWGFRAPQEP